jgi:alternate signal-mediated exported protein
MKKKKQEKTKSQKRVLIVSIVLALLIVAGATFAWFTSKDEVTNKLSASSNYGVSIVENFTPPSNWTPGQKIKKEVALVNTGNVDAIVRASIDSDINLTTEGTAIAYTVTKTVETSDDSTTTTTNNTTTTLGATTNGTNLNNSVVLTTDEVSSLQAGGRLVCERDIILDEDNFEDGTNYKPKYTGLYIFRRTSKTEVTENNVVEYSGYYYVQPDGTYTEDEDKTLASGSTLSNSSNSITAEEGAGTYYKVNSIALSGPSTVVTDSSNKVTTTFTAGIVTKKTVPLSDLKVTTGGNKGQNSSEEINSKTYYTRTDTYSKGTVKYYYSDSDYKVVDNAIVTLTDNGSIVAQLNYDYTHIQYDSTDNKTPYIKLTYCVVESIDNSVVTYTTKPVIINIYLNPEWETYWTLDRETNTFYYNNKLVQGGTSKQLVTALELDSSVTNDAYISFDYSLNIIADSVQVVVDTDGTETAEAVIGTWNNIAVDLEPTVYNSLVSYKKNGLSYNYTDNSNGTKGTEETEDAAKDAADTTSIKGITWAAYENSSTANN